MRRSPEYRCFLPAADYPKCLRLSCLSPQFHVSREKGGQKNRFSRQAQRREDFFALDTNARGENLRCRLSRVYDAASLEQFRHRH